VTHKQSARGNNQRLCCILYIWRCCVINYVHPSNMDTADDAEWQQFLTEAADKWADRFVKSFTTTVLPSPPDGDHDSPACDVYDRSHCENVGGRCWFMATMTLLHKIRSFITAETAVLDSALAFAAKMTACSDDQMRMETCEQLPKVLAMAYKQRVQNVGYEWPYENFLYFQDVRSQNFWKGLFDTSDRLAKKQPQTPCLLRIVHHDDTQILTFQNVSATFRVRQSLRLQITDKDEYRALKTQGSGFFYDAYYLPGDRIGMDRRNNARGFTSGICFHRVHKDSQIEEYHVGVKGNCHVVEGGRTEELTAATFGIQLLTDTMYDGFNARIVDDIDAFASTIDAIKLHSNENTENKVILLPFATNYFESDAEPLFNMGIAPSETLSRIMRHPFFTDYELLGGFFVQSDHVMSFVTCDNTCNILLCDSNEPGCTYKPTQMPARTYEVQLLMKKMIGAAPRWCVSDGRAFEDMAMDMDPPPPATPPPDPDVDYSDDGSYSPVYGGFAARFVDMC
jgi:hypothetical protein